ncbi:MAG: DUF4147 domain-containing protein [Candidatus Paceibacterota bacterium]|jgi:glycerate-2-kinase
MSIILNKAELLETNPELRGPALEILEAGLEAIDTEKILRKKVSVSDGKLFIKNSDLESISISLPSPASRGGAGGEVYFIGIGKCALDGAKVIEGILGGYLTQGMVIDVKDESEALTLKKIQYFKGTHPLPSEQNVEATRQILKMVHGVTEKDLIITLISGGGSALFELPIEGVSLKDIIDKTKELIARGADIYELNAARKEMSQVKGGKFAEICRPAKIVSLLFSDVLGNDISVIASGPTVIESVNKNNSLRSQDVSHIPARHDGESGGSLQEYSEMPTNILLVSNHDALEAMKIKSEELGFSTTIETEKFSGNASELGEELARRSSKNKTCILFGGETTVKLPAFAPGLELQRGKGGRNQEMALSALSHMSSDTVLICASSDGFDNTDHAGAIVDNALFQKSKDLNLSTEEYLQNSDSYNFFKKISDGAIYTGKLGSNVSDLCIILYK